MAVSQSEETVYPTNWMWRMFLHSSYQPITSGAELTPFTEETLNKGKEKNRKTEENKDTLISPLPFKPSPKLTLSDSGCCSS